MSKKDVRKQFFHCLLEKMDRRTRDLEPEDVSRFIDNAALSINFADSSGRIVWANREAVASGIIPEDFIGRSLRDLKKHRIILDPGALKALKTGKRTIGEVVQYNGRSFLSITAPVQGDRGEIDGVVAITCDIAEVYDFIRESAARAVRAVEKTESGSHFSLSDMVAESDSMREITNLVKKMAAGNCPVLILGESGTGKEVVANLIHAQSSRRANRFLAVNCGAIPAALMESELFGYEKGAFTGAWKTKPGLFEEARGGTLLLDEIGDMDLQLQVKLLRVLQEGTFRHVGGHEEIRVETRILAATNKDLPELIKRGQFREDLFYRLNVFAVKIPPLRERLPDLVKLIPLFLGRYNKEHGAARYLSRGAWLQLVEYSWPGNTRELANVMERLVVLSENDEIRPDEVAMHIRPEETALPAPLRHDGFLTLPEAVAALEKEMLVRARLKYGSCRAMAPHLGLDFSAVARKMRKYGIA